MDAEVISTGIPYGRRPKLSKVEDCKAFPTIDSVALLEKATNLLVANDWEKQLLMNIACIFNQIHSHDNFHTSDPWPEFLTLIKSEVEDTDVPTTDNGAFLEKVMNLLVNYWQKQLSDFPLELQFDHPNNRLFDMVHHVMIVGCMFYDFFSHLSDSEHNQLCDSEHNQLCDSEHNQLCHLFNMFRHVMVKIDAKKLEATLKGVEEKYYCPGTDCFIHRGEWLAGTSLSRPPPLEGRGVPVSIGLVNSDGDPSSRVKHSLLGEGSAGGFVNVSGDATGSMNVPLPEDLEMGRANNNGDPPAPRDVPSSGVPHVHVAHTADRSGWGLKVAMVGISAAASRIPTTSMFAMLPTLIGMVCNVFAIFLADTNMNVETTILAKVGILACAVGVLADMGKDLPLSLFMVAMTATIAIIIAVIFVKRLH